MSPPSPVLVSLVPADKADLDLARRRVGYERLVLVAHPAGRRLAHEVQAAEDRASGRPVCTVVDASGADVEAHMAFVRDVLDKERHAAVTVNAAGGDPALAVATLVVAFERGLETWFFQHGRADRLPVLRGVHIEERFGPDERRVLLAVPSEGATSTTVAETSLLPRPRVERAFRLLAAKGALRMEARSGRAFARVTGEGAYLADHFRAAPPTSAARPVP